MSKCFFSVSFRALGLATVLGLAAVPGLALVLAAPAQAQDAAELTVRTARLENQLRQLSGQIEQLQFENRRLAEQLRKFQEDVEFRLKERGGARPAAAPPAQKRSDAFDPAAQPNTAGGPRPLGGPAVAGAAPGTVIDEDGPLDISGGRTVPQAPLNAAPRSGPSIAATGTGTPRETYDAAIATLQRKEYEAAEMGFRQFLQSHPRDRLAADATFWLGESYYQRGRYREAAEQFLKLSRDFPKAGKAPDGLLKLGMSLNGLGARDQACATYAKVGVDYPQASSSVRQGVERETRRARCA